MSSYENKETIIEEVGNIVISLIDFPASSRSPFEEVVLFIKESKIEESRQVVLHPDQARRIAGALVLAANKSESQLGKCSCRSAYSIGYFTWVCSVHGNMATKDYLQKFTIYEPEKE